MSVAIIGVTPVLYFLTWCYPRQNPSYGVLPEEQRCKVNVLREIEQDRSGDHTSYEVPRHYTGPNTRQQTTHP